MDPTTTQRRQPPGSAGWTVVGAVIALALGIIWMHSVDVHGTEAAGHASVVMEAPGDSKPMGHAAEATGVDPDRPSVVAADAGTSGSHGDAVGMCLAVLVGIGVLVALARAARQRPSWTAAGLAVAEILPMRARAHGPPPTLSKLSVLRCWQAHRLQIRAVGADSCLHTFSSIWRFRMRYARLVAVFSVATGLALAGCGDDGDSPETGSSPTTEQQFNDADVTFAQGMIPHHRQAVEMADMASAAGGGPEVQDLADDIAAAQQPEIDTMSAWLETWGEDVLDDMSGMDHGDMDMDGMSGMMSSEDMDRLEASSGDEFDRMFLTMMIEHHEGAIEMAQTEQTDGENPGAKALAEKIEADQTEEIDFMNSLLSS